jgi:hypothetical protein
VNGGSSATVPVGQTATIAVTNSSVKQSSPCRASPPER